MKCHPNKFTILTCILMHLTYPPATYKLIKSIVSGGSFKELPLTMLSSNYFIS